MHLRAVHSDDPDADHPRVRAQPQHLPEQRAQRPLVTDPEARDRRVIGRLVSGDHPERDVLAATPLDPPRRALADRVRVHDQRHHHRRIMRRPPMTVGAIRGKERGQIQLADRLDHKPRKVILSQPLAQARRQQQLLLAITRQEVLRHPWIVLNRRTDPPLRDSHHGKHQSVWSRAPLRQIGSARPLSELQAGAGFAVWRTRIRPTSRHEMLQITSAAARRGPLTSDRRRACTTPRYWSESLGRVRSGPQRAQGPAYFATNHGSVFVSGTRRRAPRAKRELLPPDAEPSLVGPRRHDRAAGLSAVFPGLSATERANDESG